MILEIDKYSFNLPPLPPLPSFETKFNLNNNKSRLFSISTDQFSLPLLSLPTEGTKDVIAEGLKFLQIPKRYGWEEKLREEEEEEEVVEKEVRELNGEVDERLSSSEVASRSCEAQRTEPIGRISTWDSPAPGSIKVFYTSPFFTESTESIWEAEASTLPFSSNLAASPAYTKEVITESLLNVSMGFESDCFAWDEERERFDWRGDRKGKGRQGIEKVGGRIWGYSIETSESAIRPFLDLGSYIIRLQAVVNILTDSKDSSSYTSHAVARALSTFLSSVRSQIVKLRPPFFPADTSTEEPTSPLPLGLISLSIHLSPLLTSLTSLATLFKRQLAFTSPFETIPLSTPALLSLLYSNLQHHLSHSLTPPLMDQILATWLLDGALKGWWDNWEEWLGIGLNEGAKSGNAWLDNIGIEVKITEREVRGFFREKEVIENELEDKVEYILHTSQLPDFFPVSLAVELFEAGRSLRLLKKSKPNHPVCQTRVIEGSGNGLLWTDGEADRYQNAIQAQIIIIRSQISAWRSTPNLAVLPLPLVSVAPAQKPISNSIPRDLFSLLDLMDSAPGTKSINEPESSGPVITSEEQNMIDFFFKLLNASQLHTILPKNVPSLDILLNNSLFTPLQTFGRLPSTCLLTLFFTDLSLQSHLSILHSYFLLGSHSFSQRIRNALFSPPEEKDGYTLRRRRRRDQVMFGDDEGELSKERETWGVGMGILINGKGYSGTTLSLTLRTTLDDSILDAREAREKKVGRTKREKEKKIEEIKILEEVEERLSFALRLPDVGTEPKWANPHSLAALDFLYLDYKSSSPLDLFITPSVLSKYNDIFSHLLRLLRIESVAKCIWTDLSKPNTPTTVSGRSSLAYPRGYLLDSDPESRRELLRLSFEMRGLVNNIIGYSFDCAVEGNYLAFKKALGKIEKDCLEREKRGKKSDVSNSNNESIHYNTDFEDDGESQYTLDSVFSLHQTFLDRVQRGLFLKKRQAPLLKVLESGIFGVVMNLGRKTREWRRLEGTVEWNRDEVKKEIQSMKNDLRAQAVVLVNVLTALEERGGTSSKKKRGLEKNSSASVIPKELDISAERGGEESYIQELLVKLDANKFYSGKEERR